jgi:hypothetical protein
VKNWQRKDLKTDAVIKVIDTCWQTSPPLGALRVLTIMGIPEKVAIRKLEQLEDLGYIEYGVSIGYCWLTDNGKAQLQAV